MRVRRYAQRLSASEPSSDPFAAWSIQLHGHEVIYRTAGSGPPLVIVHGMVNSSKHWREVALRLAETHTVIVPDLIGHGDSATPRGDYALGAHAAVIRDLLSALEIESATFVGHSLGGGIAMVFFWQFPHKVERLALISSGGLGREVSPLLRGAALPGASAMVRAACHRSVLGAIDGIGGRTGQARLAQGDLPEGGHPRAPPAPGSRLPPGVPAVAARRDRPPRPEGLGARPPVSTGAGADADRLGRARPHDPDRPRPQRARADPGLAFRDDAARRALPEPRGPGRAQRRSSSAGSPRRSPTS